MKPTEWIKKIKKEEKLEEFNPEKFSKACLIYSKGNYGIFLLEDQNGSRYTIKVSSGFKFLEPEMLVNLYLKKFSSIPNILYIEDIFMGDNPLEYKLFRNQGSFDSFCKKDKLSSIFLEKRYFYTISKACYYNLGYFLGKYGGTLTYYAFVGFVFQLLVGLQTIHRLGVWHRDVKPANVLVCSSEIAKKYSNITYKYGDIKKWTLNYEKLGNRDLKWIDFGEAYVSDEVILPCKEFDYEVNVALVGIITLMWKKVTDKDFLELYDDLLSRLKNCSTSLLDVLFEAPIFKLLETEEEENSFLVEMLQY